MNLAGRDIVEGRVPRGTFTQLGTYVDLLTSATAEQNLVSQATLAMVWQRHILDSLQLLDLAPPEGIWVDLGSGAGLPGLVIAVASERPVILIEPRKRRADFLFRAAETLGVAHRVTVIAQRSQVVQLDPPAVISARAVAALDQLFAMAGHFTSHATAWILPKGRSAAEEVAAAKRTWQGEFRLVQSITEPESAIVVARNIRRRGEA